MIKRIDKIENYFEFAKRVSALEDFYDPMLMPENGIEQGLLRLMKDDANLPLVVLDKNDQPIGLFVFLNLAKEKYAEMLVGLSDCEAAYNELFDYLKENFSGYKIDFVYNPGNMLLYSRLCAVGASQSPRQVEFKLMENSLGEPDKNLAMLYEDRFKEGYFAIHNDDCYWTAERLLEEDRVFREIVGVFDGKVVGYLDITKIFKTNEPYDIYVLPEYRRRGIGTAMLRLAIELNGENALTVLIDETNLETIRLFEKEGFREVKGSNITAVWEI